MKDYDIINCCLLCGSDINLVLPLGSTPLANNFTDQPTQQDSFPLNVMQCQSCGHVQLDCIIDREKLFRNYLYVSGTTSSNQLHFKNYADKIIDDFQLTKSDLVCEIASNDGCLLRHFKGVSRILGIDPATNIAQKANAEGILTIVDFFTSSLAVKIAKQYGKSKVIMCNNAMAHNKQIADIIEGVRIILDQNGSFIFENSYLLDIVDKNLVDIFYHEHCHTFAIKPLQSFLNKRGMDIYDVERIPNHGGSIRVYTCFSGKKEIKQSVFDLLKLEEWINEKLVLMGRHIKQLGMELRQQLQSYKDQGKSIVIYGFPAKATTLCSALKIDMNMIDFVVEDAPLKIGKYTPFGNKEIFSPYKIIQKRPDVLLILCWNFAERVIQKTKLLLDEHVGDGKYPIFITPLPELKIE